MTSVSKNEAQAALTEIEAVTRRGLTLKGYRHAGPILMLWGVIWAVGYMGMAKMAPNYWGWLWLALDMIGVTGTLILTPKADGGGGTVERWRMSLGMAACVAFILGVVAVFPKHDPLPYLALPGLFVGFIYTVLGAIMAPRYIWIGVGVFVATLVGFFAWPGHLAEWMAVVGGCGLIISGLWLGSA
jgi:hypothetical protein